MASNATRITLELDSSVLRLHHFAAAVVSARIAHAVRLLWSSAMIALGQLLGLDRVVGAALVATLSGCLPLGHCHDMDLSSLS
jgi:hypothetical protein